MRNCERIRFKKNIKREKKGKAKLQDKGGIERETKSQIIEGERERERERERDEEWC